MNILGDPFALFFLHLEGGLQKLPLVLVLGQLHLVFLRQHFLLVKYNEQDDRRRQDHHAQAAYHNKQDDIYACFVFQKPMLIKM